MRIGYRTFLALLITVVASCLLVGVALYTGGHPVPSATKSVDKRSISSQGEDQLSDWDLSRMAIGVTGRKFAWRYHLSGPDAEFKTSDDLEVRDELHLPIDCDIELLVESDDYVYTLSIPELELRRIAIPELVYKLHFRTARAGSFEVVADPMCSVRWFHDEKMGTIVIESDSDFKRWYGELKKSQNRSGTVQK